MILNQVAPDFTKSVSPLTLALSQLQSWIVSFIVFPAAPGSKHSQSCCRVFVCRTNLILEVVGGKEGGVYTFNRSPVFSFLLADENTGQVVLQSSLLYLTG